MPAWQAFGYAGMTLVYTGGLSAVLVMVWFFRRLLRGDVRTVEAQGLVMLAGGVGIFGIGVSGAALSFSSSSEDTRLLLLPLGLGMGGLGLVIAAYGVHWFRRGS